MPPESTDRHADPEFRPKWENRRRTLFATLFFCAAIIVYIVGWGEDTRLHETALQFAFITGGGVLGSYIFGACYEETALAKIRARK